MEIRNATESDLPGIVPIQMEVQELHRNVHPEVYAAVNQGGCIAAMNKFLQDVCLLARLAALQRLQSVMRVAPVFIFGFFLAIFASPTFADPKAQAETPTKVKIGVIATLSRLGEFQGQQTIRGVQIAQEELQSENSSIAISTVIEDSQADATRAVTALKKLLEQDSIRFIIGDSWSSSTVPLLPLINQRKALLISPVAALNQLTADDFFFRTMPSVSSMTDELSRFAFETLKLRRIAIIYQQSPFGIEHKDYFTTQFQSLGGLVVTAEPIETFATDVRTQLIKMKQTHPDGFLNLNASGPPIGLVVQQANQLGISTTWLSHFGAEDPHLLEQYGSAIDKLYYPYPCTYQGQQTSQFIKRYEAKYRESADLVAGNAYDAIMMLVRAIAKVGVDPRAVRTALLADKSYVGAFGPIRFDRNGDSERVITTKLISNGRNIIAPQTRQDCSGSAT